MSATATKVRCPTCGTALRCRVPSSPEQTVKCPRCGLLFAIAQALPAVGGTQTDIGDRNQQTIDLPPGSVPARTSPANERSDNTMRLPPEEDEESEDRTLNTTDSAPRPVVEPADTLALDSSTLSDGEEEEVPPTRGRRSKPHVTEPIVEIDEEEPAPPRKKRRDRQAEGGIELGKLLAVAAIVVLIGGASAAAVWFLALKDKKQPPPSGPSVQHPEGSQPVVKPGPDRVLPDVQGGEGTVGTEVGNTAPEISGEMLSGMAYNLSDFRGKVVLLDFWGDWCPYCKSCYGVEKDLVLKLGGRPFVMLGVNVDRTKDAARAAIERDALNWDSWYDGRGGNIADRWEVDGFPSFFLIDHRGVIRKRFSGADKKELGKLFAEAEELVRDAEAARR